MKHLYLECNMGAAGDMILAALTDCMDRPDEFVNQLNGLGLPGVTYELKRTEKCGISGAHMSVLVHGKEELSEDVSLTGGQGDEILQHSHTEKQLEKKSHKHHNLKEIQNLIDTLEVENQVKKDAKAVYGLLAEAEGHVHNKPVDQIHFHEVGNMDAVADVVGVCLALHQLGISSISASPIHVGSGQVKCSHGILPVPTPATAYLLRQIPVYGGQIRGELCTPTGAAIIRYFCKEFGPMKTFLVDRTGYGMGNKDFPVANMVRAFYGEIAETDTMDEIVELCCNLDDITPERMGFVTELLLQEGALDVYVTNIQMKKNRPGFLLTCMCRASLKQKFLELIFRHTTTLGVREYTCKRYGLERSIRRVETDFGPVRIKTSTGYGVKREKIEYEDLARISREEHKSMSEIEELIQNQIKGE